VLLLLQAAAAALLAGPPLDPDAAARLDFSSHEVFTIDDASTTEIDDGLSLERLPNGSVKVSRGAVLGLAGGSCVLYQQQ
jgi:exoribonuclease-2